MQLLFTFPILLVILFANIEQNQHFADASCCCCCKPCCCGCTCVGPCQCCNPPLLIKLPRTCPCCCKCCGCCCCRPCCCCCGCGGGGGRKKRSIVLRSVIEAAKTGKPAPPAIKMPMPSLSCPPAEDPSCKPTTMRSGATECQKCEVAAISANKSRARRMAFGATFLFA
ncbi:hypothetical protein niasHT_039605 [Heterodera trifolii]|uniref:Effector protein n=1 Tax=Heterodera trifolii TaxID=157864 RepID=A0ABD2IKF9_9BILA